VSNQPAFDPLRCTPEEQDDMVRGYRDGRLGNPIPADASIAYEHGRRNGVSDRTGHIEPDQRALARRYLEAQRKK
jgi:hypothetical protein